MRGIQSNGIVRRTRRGDPCRMRERDGKASRVVRKRSADTRAARKSRRGTRCAASIQRDASAIDGPRQRPRSQCGIEAHSIVGGAASGNGVMRTENSLCAAVETNSVRVRKAERLERNRPAREGDTVRMVRERPGCERVVRSRHGRGVQAK